MININSILEREKQIEEVRSILRNIDNDKSNLLIKKGIYVYGESGSGKTQFVMNILNEMNYNVIKYDAGDVRSEKVIMNLTKKYVSSKNILGLFNDTNNKIAIVMDEIDGMNSGDKGGIDALIRLIRPKKTKKQKKEETTLNPIFCIGNLFMDKKIKELMKVCHSIHLETPTPSQISLLLRPIKINSDKIVDFIQGDLRKLKLVYDLKEKNPAADLDKILINTSYNNDTNKLTANLLSNCYGIEDHNILINETDRTTIGLLWHENIIDLIEKYDKRETVPFYLKQLENICYADYIDRITFQKQIWQFNEISSLIKTFSNMKMYHDFMREKGYMKPQLESVRFTKAVTRYSTEYNNSLFIQKLCYKLGMIDKKDLFSFFLSIKNDEKKIEDVLETYDVTKLDVSRLYRYLSRKSKDLDIDMDIDEDIEDIYVE